MATVAERILALAALTTPAAGDALAIVDVSDTGMAATGTTKHIVLTDFFGGVPVNIVQGNALNIQTDKVRARDGDGLYLVDDGDNGLFIADGGNVFLGDTANTRMTLGLTLNQGANDDEILALKSSDVAHGMTDVAEADTYGHFKKANATNGAITLAGLGAASYAFVFRGYAAAANVTKSAAGAGVMNFDSYLQDGTGTQAMSANSNLVLIRNNVAAVAIFDAEGELHLDLTLAENVWDEYDDLELITALRASVMSPKTALYQRTKHLIEKHRGVLEETGVITYNEDGHHFIAMKAFTFLLTDAIRQIGAQLQAHKQALLDLGISPKLLEA